MPWKKWSAQATRFKLGLRILLFFAVIFVFLSYLGYRMLAEGVASPCAPSGYPARCYRMTQKMCEAVWNNSEVTCKEFVQKLSLPAGRLTGPIQAKCQFLRVDEAFLHSRKSTPECNELFTELEDWKRRNDFK